MRRINQDYFRSIIFGLEDALVSTTGVVVGLSAGTNNREVIILASFVTVTVEALSMGAGQFLSERAVHQLARNKKSHSDNLVVGSLLMLVAYFFAGLVPIWPILIFSPPLSAVISVASGFFGLFLLGLIKGKITKVPAIKSAFEILFIGGLAATIGVLVGRFFGTS